MEKPIIKHYDLLDYPKELHNSCCGKYVIVNIGDPFSVSVHECGSVSFCLRDPRYSENCDAIYSYLREIPESVKFYNPHNDAFYCFKNVKQVLEAVKG